MCGEWIKNLRIYMRASPGKQCKVEVEAGYNARQRKLTAPDSKETKK